MELRHVSLPCSRATNHSPPQCIKHVQSKWKRMEYENHQKCARHPEGCSCCFTLNRKHSLLLRIRCWVPKTHHVRSRHLHWKLKHLTSVESLCFTGLHACFKNVCLIFQDDTALTHCSSFFEAIKLITISVVCLPRPATHWPITRLWSSPMMMGPQRLTR